MQAMDYFDAAEHGETLTHALRKVDAQAVRVIGVETDSLFPVAQRTPSRRHLKTPSCPFSLLR